MIVYVILTWEVFLYLTNVKKLIQC